MSAIIAEEPKTRWRTVTLGEACEIYQPRTISQKDMTTDGKYPVFGANGKIGRYREYNHEEPQLLVTCRGATCGAVNISEPFSWITGNAMVVRPKTKDIDTNFLRYFFLGAIDFSKVITGAAQPQITRKSLSPTEIRIPSVGEQKRIVAVLDQTFAALERARAHAEANLAAAEDIFNQCLTTTFDLSLAPAKECFAVSEVFQTSTGSTPKKSEKALYGRDVPFVKPPELSDAVVGETQDGLSELGGRKARLAPPGAVLVSCIGNLGKIGLLDRKSAFNQQINAIIPDTDKAIPEFIFFQCRSQPFRKQIEARAGGTTVAIVNKKQFNALTLWIPRVADQAAMVEKLKAVEALTEKSRRLYEKKCADIDQLRQSILHAAFSGRLT